MTLLALLAHSSDLMVKAGCRSVVATVLQPSAERPSHSLTENTCPNAAQIPRVSGGEAPGCLQGFRFQVSGFRDLGIKETDS